MEEPFKIHSRKGQEWICTHYRVDSTEEFIVPYTIELSPVYIENVGEDDLVFSTDQLEGIFVCNKRDVVWYPSE